MRFGSLVFILTGIFNYSSRLCRGFPENSVSPAELDSCIVESISFCGGITKKVGQAPPKTFSRCCGNTRSSRGASGATVFVVALPRPFLQYRNDITFIFVFPGRPGQGVNALFQNKRSSGAGPIQPQKHSFLCQQNYWYPAVHGTGPASTS